MRHPSARMSGIMKRWLPLTVTCFPGYGGFLAAADYTLSFEQRSRFEQVSPGVKGASTSLQVWANRKMVALTGRWHEVGGTNDRT
jgi:hypothetical protein